MFVQQVTRLVVLVLACALPSASAQMQVQPEHIPPVNVWWDWTGTWTLAPGASATVDFSSAGSVVMGASSTFAAITGSDSSLGITGLAATSSTGGAVAIVGGATTTSGAGGAASMTGGAGSGTSNGGAVSIVGGISGAGATGTGGQASVTGGSAASTNGAGGAASVNGGTGAGTGNGGAVSVGGGTSGGGATGNGGAANVTGGDAASTNGTGGAVGISGGAATGTGTGGAVSISAGDSAGASGTAGAVTIDAGAATGGTAGAITIGGTNAGSVAIGRNSATFEVTSSGLDINVDGAITIPNGNASGEDSINIGGATQGVSIETYTETVDLSGGAAASFALTKTFVTTEFIISASMLPAETIDAATATKIGLGHGASSTNPSSVLLSSNLTATETAALEMAAPGGTLAIYACNNAGEAAGTIGGDAGDAIVVTVVYFKLN